MSLPALSRPSGDAARDDPATTGDDATDLAGDTGAGDVCDDPGPDSEPLVVDTTRLSTGREELAQTATLVHREPGSFELYRSGTDLHWCYDDLGRLRVRDGRRIDLDLAPGVDDATREHLVLGPGAYSALVQRGRPVVHGCAVAIDGRAVVVAGATGRGKSTTAAACYAAGHEVLGDDVAAISVGNAYGVDEPETVDDAGAVDEPGTVDDAGVRVDPAFPRVRVDREVAGALGLSVAGPGAEAGEVAVDVADGFRASPAPLAGVYLLETGDGPARSIDLDGPAALFELQRATYLLAPGSDRDALAEHQSACADVVREVPVRRLVRPDSLDDVDELVAVLEDDVAATDGG